MTWIPLYKIRYQTSKGHFERKDPRHRPVRHFTRDWFYILAGNWEFSPSPFLLIFFATSLGCIGNSENFRGCQKVDKNFKDIQENPVTRTLKGNVKQFE